MDVSVFTDVMECLTVLKGALADEETILTLAAACDNDPLLYKKLQDYHDSMPSPEELGAPQPPPTIRRDRAKDAFDQGRRLGMSYTILQQQLLSQVFSKCESIKALRTEKILRGTATMSDEIEELPQLAPQPAAVALLPPVPPPLPNKALFKLFISGVDPCVEAVAEAFRGIPIKNITLPPAPADGKPRQKRFCFVEFPTFDDLDRAAALSSQPTFAIGDIPLSQLKVDFPKGQMEELSAYSAAYQRYKEELAIYEHKLTQLNASIPITTHDAPVLPQTPLDTNSMKDDVSLLSPVHTVVQKYGLPHVVYSGPAGSVDQSVGAGWTTLVILNMFTDDDKNEVSKEELIEEVNYECKKYGEVCNTLIDLENAVFFDSSEAQKYYPVFVQYSESIGTIAAYKMIQGRTFADRPLMVYISDKWIQ